MSRPAYFHQKPEAALQRAIEFISVGKEQDALQALHDIIKMDRRHKQWSQTYEQIMFKYVELCVKLKNSNLAKDGLYQYKILTQQVATKSLENVLDKYLSLAEAKTGEAQKNSIERIEEIDDLDVADAPERLLLSVVSGALAQDRMDRTVLSPWLRFLWDSYRNCLDLLRNNVLFEQLYHQIAKRSFLFCQKYQRRSEFRKLCEILRLHLGQIQKSQASYAVKLSNVDSLTLMMETRLVQLDTAIAMELWQEAFKSAEDLHNIMQLTKDKDKKIVKPATIVNYYEKISLVFWKGKNTLFHAAALLQKFNIYKDMKKTFTDEEAFDQATRVLLATLSIPDGADHPSILTKRLDVEELHHANIRILSTLLRLSISPTRSGLLKEISRLSLPELADTHVNNLYKSIELEFNPVKIAAVVEENLANIIALNRPEYNQYIDDIKAAVTLKILKQLSKVFDSLSFSRLEKIIPFYKSMEMERFLVDASKNHSLKVQVDHKTKSIHFCRSDSALTCDAESELEEKEGIQNHLKSLYAKLCDFSKHINDDTISVKLFDQIKKQIRIYNQTKDHDYDHIIMRRKKIENYKESSETIRLEKIQQEKEMQSKLEEKRKEEERKRIELINKENEVKRKAAEKEEILKKTRMEKIRRIQSTPFVQQIIKERGEDVFETMDVDEVLKEQRLRMDAERKELQQRLYQQEKKFDHMIRAFHLEEMLIRKEKSTEHQKNAPKLFEEYEENRIAKSKEDHTNSVHAFQRLQLAKSNASSFIKELIDSNKDDFDLEYHKWERSVEKAREQATNEIKADRERKRQMEKHIKKEEEERKRDEQARKKIEEEKRQNEERRKEKYQAIRAQTNDMSQVSDRTRNVRPVQDENWRMGGKPSAPTPTPISPQRNAGSTVRTGGVEPATGQAQSEETYWRSSKPRATSTAAPPPTSPKASHAHVSANEGGTKGAYVPPHMRRQKLDK